MHSPENVKKYFSTEFCDSMWHMYAYNSDQICVCINVVDGSVREKWLSVHSQNSPAPAGCQRFTLAVKSIKRNHITKNPLFSKWNIVWITAFFSLPFFSGDLTYSGDMLPTLLSVLFLFHPLLLHCHFLFAVTESPLPLKDILTVRQDTGLVAVKAVFNMTKGLFLACNVPACMV